jgi:hypothetical protein
MLTSHSWFLLSYCGIFAQSSQRNSRCWAMLARNNRGIATIRVVTLQSLLWNRWVNTFLRRRVNATIEELFSVRSVPRVYENDKGDRLSQLGFGTPACQGAWEQRSCLENWESCWRWQSNDWEEMARKELVCEKKFSCVLQWQWDSYKCLPRIRRVKTENISACVTVSCKECRSAIALYYL